MKKKGKKTFGGSLSDLYSSIFTFLPDPIKTKLTKSGLDRGGDGIYTKRRKRNDVVFVPYSSFINAYGANFDTLDSLYKEGYFILFSPKEFNDGYETLRNSRGGDFPKIVRYQDYAEKETYPYNPSDIAKKENGKIVGFVVVDIKNLDKHKNKGGNEWTGPKLIAQHDFDYATSDEILNVKLCLLFQIIKTVGFFDWANNHPKSAILLSLVNDYVEKFYQSPLWLENPNLQKFTQGFTKCPVLIVELMFNDLIEGTIEGDDGRENWNRTATKINLHHIDRLISGKLNHNHKNVFLGTSAGNTIDSALFQYGWTLEDLIRNHTIGSN